MLSNSAKLLKPENSSLLVIDIQERLLPLILNANSLENKVKMLLTGAGSLDIPCFLSEQYPEKLGKTIASIKNHSFKNVYSKRSFGLGLDCDFLSDIQTPNIIICGIESHVCVLQTVLQILESGTHTPYVVADAIDSRFPEDTTWAIERLKQEGVKLLSAEMIVFEWLQTSTHKKFKEIAPVFRDRKP